MDERVRRIDAFADMDSHPRGMELVGVISQVCGGAMHRQRARDLLPLLQAQPGQAILEVGCGTGAVLRELAVMTKGATRLVGIDPSALALQQAAGETASDPEAAGLAGAISFRQMDGSSLAFPNGSFAAALSSRVLIHAPDPPSIVAEMARVVQPRGRILCIEPVHQFTAGVDDALRRKVSGWTNPDVGRELPALLRAAGLVEVTVTPHVAIVTEPPDVRAMRAEFEAGRGTRAATVSDGFCTADEVHRLLDQIDAAIQRGVYLECYLHFAVLGRKRL